MAAAKTPDTEGQFKTIMQNLQQRKFVPVYFLMGGEPFYIDKISKYLEEHILTEGERSFNQTIVYGRDTDCKQIVNMCKRYPMMADYQVIVVKEAQNLKDTDSLIPYFENPLKSTILVMCWKSDKVDKRTKFYKVVKELQVFESQPVAEYNLSKWINSYMHGRHLVIAPRTADLLAAHLGSDLTKIENEIDKILINKPGAKEITSDDIEKYVGISKEFNVFELQSAIGQRNLAKAMKIVNNMGEGSSSKNSIIPTISILYGYFAKLYTFQHLPDKGNNSAIQALGVNYYGMDDFKNAGRNYPKGKIEKVMGVLLNFDLRAKGVNDTGTADKELFKEMLAQIMT
ncbi:MAG: DNA polymerase III subunit delta [Bacteroidota bacterium]|nr:DNA polymerase III subunit delta [Bacteroidota bacterium]